MELNEFKTQVISTKNKLYRFAKSFLHHEEEAEDTVQDVLLKMWNIRDKLSQYNSVEALAMRMIKNQCLDKLKSKKNGLFNLDENSQSMVSDFVAPDKKLEINDSMDLMQKAMLQLPEQQQQSSRLRDIEEMEFEEIAEILVFDLNYIRVNLSRARKKLREILTNFI